MRDKLIGTLIGMARACENKEKTVHTNEFFVKGLFLAATAACQKQNVLEEMVREVQKEKYRIVPDCEHCASPCGNTSDYDLNQLYQEEEPVRSVKFALLDGILSLAAKMDDTVWQQVPKEVCFYFHKVLCMISYDLEETILQNCLSELGSMHILCKKGGLL